jgi:hypothetical protein
MLSLRLAAFLYAFFVVRDLARAVAFDGFPPTRADVERGMLSSLPSSETDAISQTRLCILAAVCKF